MRTRRPTQAEPADGADLVAAAQAGDETAFNQLVGRHRRELQVHCYRMLGSFVESEDLVQETFLRAWRRLDSFEGRSSFRAWLYRIATNACLDALAKEKGSRRALAYDVDFDLPDLAEAFGLTEIL
jgi:RNA polymerase sigma-70 factor (ECF subfamily)